MRNTICRLPNGQSYTVTPVFGGFNFKSNDMHLKSSIIPPGWTIVLYTSQDVDQPIPTLSEEDRGRSLYAQGEMDENRLRTTRFTIPTLDNDCFYISYIVNPPSTDFKPPTSPTRQIAMMLWVSLYWYFQEPEPDLRLRTEAASRTPETGRPKGEWRISLKREGIFKGRNLFQKLERMGLIATEDSSVGHQPVETRDSQAWSRMFVSRRSFWQIDPRLFVFTPTPTNPLQSALSSPFLSPRFASPSRDSLLGTESGSAVGKDILPHTPTEGPFASSSHLPTYFPPPPTQYTFTNGLRHPVRPKPPHQGEVFYIRYIPSVGQYLSFRVPNLPASGPASHLGHSENKSTSSIEIPPPSSPSDLDLLHKWMNDARVDAAWGEGGPITKQEDFLRKNLSSRHSFPVIGCWDGKPFGYFEIYWIKEDRLGPLIGGADNYDRGIHLLVGEQEYRGAHRVAIWLSSLVHYCWLADLRTQTVMLEPRVDNVKIIRYLQDAGFYKEGEVTFPHKQSALMKIKRDSWESPVL
ncbi:GNAT family N-acetyltransferase [Aspergillus clavatus NRRL 1]|uniref:Siderophore biosynthesis protein, putative n=1 Tax=Aspergillus clavatus (strain ATCC 1007 / CBS 513.65 / DSM 816 / NCTC 3887 / NRRL 1 / QM 1276 / 107) TaxID=344612 RepID=A1CRP5_ASPCL|nr:siderophore biosynthesis protein, putative [Aspergillus clavatus NRRL 1]EAW08316.1 siderophore biosynthesis protein, putative [Aspergillus clavatus NRRL 1]